MFIAFNLLNFTSTLVLVNLDQNFITCTYYQNEMCPKFKAVIQRTLETFKIKSLKIDKEKCWKSWSMAKMAVPYSAKWISEIWILSSGTSDNKVNKERGEPKSWVQCIMSHDMLCHSHIRPFFSGRNVDQTREQSKSSLDSKLFFWKCTELKWQLGHLAN